MTFEIVSGGYVVSDDPARINRELVHAWLAEDSYWARGRTRETVDRSLDNGSIVFGAYDQAGSMVGTARVVTDRATFGWLCDVFVASGHRGSGIGTALVQAAVSHPELAGLKRYVLATADAHDLYARFGFEALDKPERWMIRRGETA